MPCSPVLTSAELTCRTSILVVPIYRAPTCGKRCWWVPVLLVPLCHGQGSSPADLTGACLIAADVSHSALTSANLTRCDLSRANLEKAGLGGARLFGARLDETVLNGTNLDGANLDNSSLVKARMFGEWGVTQKGESHYGRFKEINSETGRMEYTYGGSVDPDSHGWIIEPASLKNASLRNADLTGADVRGVDLRSADLSGVNRSAVGAKDRRTQWPVTHWLSWR